MRTAAAGLVLLTAALLAAQTSPDIKWVVPPSWKLQPQASSMRLATYQIRPAPGDRDNAECGVYYFGQGQGGSVEANVDRWVGQFQQANGKSSKNAAKVEKRTIHDLKVTTVDVSGAYTGMGGPRAPEGPPKQSYRLLGAIVEGPQGSVFFKFTGPAKTVAENQSIFEKMISSLKIQ
jgi:hypothetical protein